MCVIFPPHSSRSGTFCEPLPRVHGAPRYGLSSWRGLRAVPGAARPSPRSRKGRGAMLIDSLVFATMTLARTASEERVLESSLTALAGFGRPVCVTDGGSSDHFVAFLRTLPNVIVVSPEAPGLISQVRASLRTAAALGAGF